MTQGLIQSFVSHVLAVALALALTVGTAATASDEIVATFLCDGLGPVEARFGSAQVVLLLPDGQTITLPQRLSGSGARFGDDTVEFWNHGDEATLTRTGTGYACGVAAESSLLREAVEMTGTMMYLGFQPPALILGVVRDGETVVEGFGEYRPGADLPPDGDTVMRIGSITKTFTAATLAGLVADGAVNLTDRLEDHLGWDVAVPSRPGHPIRLLHLATHTSGLPREVDVELGPADDPFANFTPQAMARNLESDPLLFAPGTGAFYSNFGFGLLAAALGNIGDQPYERLLTDRVLTRVGLTATGYAPADGHAVMQGHDFAGDPMADAPTPEGIQGTGGLYSSANDILRWLSWHLDRFTDENAAMRLIDHAAYVPRDALDVVYGMDESGRMDAMALGWVVMYARDGRPTILQKAGGRQGIFAYAAFAPAHGVGAFVAINQFDLAVSMAMAQAVNDLIADLAVR